MRAYKFPYLLLASMTACLNGLSADAIKFKSLECFRYQVSDDGTKFITLKSPEFFSVKLNDQEIYLDSFPLKKIEGFSFYAVDDKDPTAKDLSKYVGRLDNGDWSAFVISDYTQPAFGIKEAYDFAEYHSISKSTVTYTSVCEEIASGSIAFQRANELYAANEFDRARRYYEIALIDKSAGAAVNLAAMYQDGVGVPQDLEKSREYVRLAAEYGSPMAQRVIGTWYLSGSGVDKDYAKALEFFTVAAEKQDPYAQHNIGHMYQNGLGVKQSNKAAIDWYFKSCKNPASQSDEDCRVAASLMTKIAMGDIPDN